MSQFETFAVLCDRCQFEFNQDSYIGEVAVCQHCGWVGSEIESSQTQQTQKRYLFLVAGLTAFFILAFIHVINWDRHSIAIIPLKMKYGIGLADKTDLKELALICTERMKYLCTEGVLTEMTSVSGTPEEFVQLGDLRRKLDMHNEATIAYEDALQAIGQQPSTFSADAHYGLALSLEKVGDNKKADTHYALALETKPNVIQITVTESYIRFLQRIGESKKAASVLDAARKKSGSSRLLAALEKK